LRLVLSLCWLGFGGGVGGLWSGSCNPLRLVGCGGLRLVLSLCWLGFGGGVGGLWSGSCNPLRLVGCGGLLLVFMFLCGVWYVLNNIWIC